MKILMITRKFSTDEPTASGVQKYLANLVSRLSQDNEVLMLAAARDLHKKNYSMDIVNESSIKLIKITKNSTPLGNILLDPLSLVRDRKIEGIFLRLIKQERPDIVHVHHLGYFSFGVVNAAKQYGIPVVITLHDFGFICNNIHKYLYIAKSPNDKNPKTCNPGSEDCAKCFNDYYYRRLREELSLRFGVLSGVVAFFIKAINFIRGFTPKKIFQMRSEYSRDALNSASVLLAASESVKKVYSHLIDPSKITVLPLGIIPPKAKKTARLSGKKITFAYLGGVKEHKGFFLALEAFSSLKSGEAELLIYGEDSDPRQAGELLKKHSDVKNVHFKGVYDDPDEAFSKTDVLVVPSICEETYSLVAHEAAAAGIPVIAPKSGAFPEFVKDGINGFLFCSGDSADLKEKMGKFIGQPQLLDTFGGHITPVENMDNHARKIMSLYRSLIAKSSSGV